MRFSFTKLPIEELDDVTLNLDQLADGIVGVFLVGVGIPAATLGVDGQGYWRLNGAPGSVIYYKAAGAWTAIA